MCCRHTPDPTGSNVGAVVHDFHHSEGDQLLFDTSGQSATLTHSGDVWTVHDVEGEFTFEISGITSLSSSDYHFG